MNKKILTLLLFLLIAALLYGCNFPWAASVSGPPVNGGAAQTAAAQTVAAQLTLNAQQGPPLPLNTNPPPQPPPNQATNTTQPTNTLAPTHTATKSIPCDDAGFVNENVPDGTEYAPSATFTKKWVIVNEGSCTWTSGYQWVFSSGDSMGGPATKQITSGTVAPGQTVEVEIALTAPASAGTYRGTYQIRNSGGQIFTTNGFWVEIKVVSAFNYSLALESILDCPPEVITIKTTNTGSKNLESGQFKVEDLTDSSTLVPWTAFINKPWRDKKNCDFTGSAIDNVAPGGYYYVTLSGFPALTSGHDIRIQTKLCSQDAGAGDCLTKKVDAEVP